MESEIYLLLDGDQFSVNGSLKIVHFVESQEDVEFIYCYQIPSLSPPESR